MSRLTRVASRRAAVVLTTAALLLAGTATAAYAAADVNHGDDRAWTIGADGVTTWVQDNECDGNRVTVEVNLRSGNYMSFPDYDGCGGNIEWRNSFDGSFVDSIRVCEATKGCSPWEDS
jgi:hypothetical protein